MNSFLKRLISGIVLIALLIITAVPGGVVTCVAYMIISLIGLYELLRVFSLEKTPLGIVALALSGLYYLDLLFGKEQAFPVEIWTVVLVLALMLIMVVRYPNYTPSQIALSVLSCAYVPYLLSFVVKTRGVEHGLYYVWLIFFTSWGCDTLAYCSGMLFGKHKLCPNLSPKKSVEGAVGGTLGAALLGAIYGLVLYRFFEMDQKLIWTFAIICGCSAIMSQIGDLIASAIKRNYDVKDYGTLIPGHGGIMDRFDSVIVTAPLVFYLCSYILNNG